MMMPSRQAIIAEIVGPDLLLNAVALNTLGMNVLRFIAPAIAGFLVDLYGFESVYYSTSAMYLAAVFFVYLMPITDTISVNRGSTLKDLKEGINYIRNEPTILIILILALVIVVLARPYQFLLPIFTDDILKVGATGLGILMSVSGLGAMFGSTILASLPNTKRGLLLIISGLIMSIAIVGFAFSESWILSLIMITIIGLGDTGRVTLANTLVQYYVENKYRGRVMSVLIMQFGLMSFGVFFAGIITEVIGVQWCIGGLGILLIILSLMVLCFSRRLRNLE
jgi:MFS family permease